MDANRTLFDLYLEHPTFENVRCLTFALQPCMGDIDPTLRQKMSTYIEAEESRMERVLESISFDIDAPETLLLVTGRGRIERVSEDRLYLLKEHI